MSSACINAAAPLPDLSSRDRSPPSYGWLRSRISTAEEQQPDDFEFRLDDPAATMLPADELFSGGRLVPLHLAPPRPVADEIRSPEATTKEEIPSGPSPRAPKCSSRWRELLGLKRQQQQSVSKPAAAAAPATSRYPNPRSLKLFLRRDTKSAADPSQSLSLLRDSDLESVSLSSRRSLSSSSSSSSGQDHEELPRLSLDTEKPGQIPSSRHPHPPKVRVSRPRSATPDRRPAARSGRSPVRRPAEAAAAAPRGVSVDSPRMNASGRVVFQGLDRSSSSPGSFTGGPRVRNLAIERSYSAGVRVTPVLNVPAFGLGNLFRKEREGPSASRATATGVAAGGGVGVGVGAKNKIDRA